MISVRFLPILCVLFALALVPTLVHSYAFDPPPAGHVTAASAGTARGPPDASRPS